jgi:hypothetical protein
MYTYVTVDSQDGVGTPDNFMRFPVDSVFRDVREVEWLTMEISHDHALTIDESSKALFFTEELRFYKAELPLGAYSSASLCKALEAAMSCATAEDGEGPRNKYTVRLLEDSSRLSISSDGGVAFAIHNFKAMLKIKSLRRLGTDKTVQITAAHHHEGQPMVRGSLLRVFMPGKLPAMVQVLHAVGDVLLVHQVGNDAFERDINSEEEGWTTQAICNDTVLPELLGLGATDLRSSQPIQVTSSSSPLLGTSGSVEQKPMHLGLAHPHGCVEGDVVSLDGFEGAFVNGQMARVMTVVSEQQLVVGVDASRMGAFPKNQNLRLSANGKEFSFRVQESTLESAEENCVCVRVAVERGDLKQLLAMKAHEATPARMLPPVPSREWIGENVTVLAQVSKLGGSLLLRCPYKHVGSPNSSIKRNAVVGMKKMSFLHKKSVLFMRLRLGTKEACGVVSLKENNRHVFGRAQMKEGAFLVSSDHSLVGRAKFDPPLERVRFLEIAFETPQGAVVHPNLLGDFSMLLRLSCSP